MPDGMPEEEIPKRPYGFCRNTTIKIYGEPDG